MACREVSFAKILRNRGFFAIALFVFGLIFSAAFFIFQNYSARAAVTPPALITYQGKVLQNGLAVSTTLSMKFVLYNALAGGSILYTASGTISATTSISVTPTSGLFYVELGGSGTNTLDPSIFANNDTVYLQVEIGGQILTPRKRLTASPYAINAKYLDGYFATSTPTTTAYIPVADSSGNFQFNGVSTTAITLGSVRRTNWGGILVGTTTVSYAGSITSTPSYVGYDAAHRICNSNYTGSHFCTPDEVINTIATQSISNFAGTAWIANGPPGYLASANDCLGYTATSASVLGAFWEFSSSGGGKGWLVNCSQSKPIACCR